MDLRDFSKVNLARCESPQGFDHAIDSWSGSDWLVAALGELGEAANVLKKLNRARDGVRGNRETPAELRDKLSREIADTFIYLDLFAQAEGIDLNEAVIRTFEAKSEEIGYPKRLFGPLRPERKGRSPRRQGAKKGT